MPKQKDKSNDDLLEVPKGWKPEEFKKEHNPHGMIEKSTFATLFPKYKEKYILECWPLIEKRCLEYGLAVELDLVKGVMSVSTTRKAYDPYIIIKARDFFKLLSRSVPYEKALRVFDDECQCDIIRIDGMVKNNAIMVRRRKRIEGDNGSTLKAIEMLTGCTVVVHGKTVSVIGSWTGLKHVRKIVIDAMNNYHPIYNIKTLMVKQQLAKDPDLKDENWDRFLPKFQKTSSKHSKPFKVKKKKEYTPFPPPMPESKVDIELRTGEYFMKQSEKDQVKMEKKKEAAKKFREIKDQKKAAVFVPPTEKSYKRKSMETKDVDVDIKALKKKVKKAKKNA